MRFVSLLLYVFLLSLLLSLIVFLLTTPTPQGNRETKEDLPWEQDSEEYVPLRGPNRALREALEGPEVVAMVKAEPRLKRRFRYSVVQDSRQVSLQKACRGVTNQTWSGMSDQQRQTLSQRIVVSDEHHLLYCTVPLVGTGPWMKVFYFLGHHGEGLDDIGKVAAKELGNRKNFVYLSSFSAEERTKRIQSYLKFMVTRHPFLRLGIAYKLKFEADNAFFHDRYGKEIVRKHRQGAGKNPAGNDIKFSEFAQYVSSVREQSEMNEHWETLHHLCHPCQVGYDFILHHETLTQDSVELLEAAMLSDTVPRFPHDHWDAIPISYVHGLFKSVTASTVGRLVNQYKEDFALFSYSSLF